MPPCWKKKKLKKSLYSGLKKNQNYMYCMCKNKHQKNIVVHVFWFIRMHKPCSLTSMAHIFKSLIRGFCASAASISFCASGLLVASDSRALAAFTWQRVFVLFAKQTSGLTAPLATTRSWFSLWFLAKELRHAAVLAWRFFDLASEKLPVRYSFTSFCQILGTYNTYSVQVNSKSHL